jgi:DNA-binding IclR family transcriptional regulator
LDKFIDSYFLDRKEGVEQRYLKVLRYLNEHPSTTSGLTANLSMVALEASTILNEMVFLGWVSLDHISKLYRITDAGADILSNDQT